MFLKKISESGHNIPINQIEYINRVNTISVIKGIFRYCRTALRTKVIFVKSCDISKLNVTFFSYIYSLLFKFMFGDVLILISCSWAFLLICLIMSHSNISVLKYESRCYQYWEFMYLFCDEKQYVIRLLVCNLYNFLNNILKLEAQYSIPYEIIEIL